MGVQTFHPLTGFRLPWARRCFTHQKIFDPLAGPGVEAPMGNPGQCSSRRSVGSASDGKQLRDGKTHRLAILVISSLFYVTGVHRHLWLPQLVVLLEFVPAGSPPP